MCSQERYMRMIDTYWINRLNEEHMAVPPKSGSYTIFYPRNQENKTWHMPAYLPVYINPRSKCFGSPLGSPLGSCHPRTHVSARPLTSNEIQIPTRAMLRQNYTLKVDKRFLRKEE